MDLFEHVGNRIRELRTGYAGEGMSQETLGQKLGVATNTVSRWETATYQPSIQDLQKLSEVFGVSILTFFPGEEVKEDENVRALLRAVGDLSAEDLKELQAYAEFRRARKMYSGARKRPGRPRGAKS